MTDSNWQAAEEDALFDENEAFNLDKFDSNKDSILFVIDCAPEMFQVNPQLKELTEADAEAEAEEASTAPQMSAFSAALKCASATMQNKIISSENDRVGVLFYNTSESKNPAGFPGIFLMLQLDIPDAPGIRELERFAKKPELFREAYCKTGVAGARELPFGNVFWSAATLFADQKDGTKRIFLFTCEDNPNASSPALQRAARTRGRDLADIGIALELFALPKPQESSFNSELFYRSIIPPQDAQEASNIAKFEELMARVRRREQRKRALARTELSLGPDFSLSVRLYSLFMEAKRGQYVWMDERSGEVMAPKTEWICKETGSIVNPKDFQFSYDYGQEKAIFTKEELIQLHGLGEEPGLKAIGFKPRSALKVSHNLTHSTFIYPDEMEIRGSVVLFAGLLKAAAAANQFILCRYTARKGAAIRLVALLPQLEEFDELGSQIKAPGFHMIILPFADDLRHLRFDKEEAARVCASHEQIDKAKAVIGKLTLKGRFDPDAYDNPFLQHHYATLQALALDEDSPQAVHDSSMPNLERMQQRASAQLDELKAALNWDSAVDEKAPQNDRTKAKKRQVDHEAVSGESMIESIQKAANQNPDSLNQFMVVDLKAYLESKGIRPKRVKADLISQILESQNES